MKIKNLCWRSLNNDLPPPLPEKLPLKLWQFPLDDYYCLCSCCGVKHSCLTLAWTKATCVEVLVEKRHAKLQSETRALNHVKKLLDPTKIHI